MICPLCKEPMLILEYDKIELDYCPTCEGIWMDAGELELLLGTQNQILDLSDFPHSTRSRRNCPRCRKKMRLTRLFESEIELDICPRDGGIWLDKGELLEVARSQASAGNLKNIRNFFSTLFLDKTE